VIISVTRTVRLKVKSEAYAWLDAAAIEVNQVFNWCNATSLDAADRNRRAHAKFLSGFDLCNLSAGASEYFQHIGADTIQKVCTGYATKRRTAKSVRLRWRVSRGSRQSLGWVPFKAGSVKRRGVGLRFCGKLFRVFDREYLGEHRFRDGCFAKDPVGDWWLCLPVAVEAQETPAGRECVGVDLGLKSVAVTSDGERLEAGRFYRGVESKIAQAQRRTIVVGDVSPRDDRDVNAARNILTVRLRCRASMSGNESPATWRRLPRRSFRGELDQRPAQAA
jgi:putative transposase